MATVIPPNEQFKKLLDFNQKLDITLLDNIVECMYTGMGVEVRISSPTKRILQKIPCDSLTTN
jgi:hypothetical protein